MATTGLLALLDDIATVLDDVAMMSKVAAKKTAGVLGDDLALNAEQVSGIKANRELPVIWAVFKGSALNKLILVPLALLISAIFPAVVTPMLMLGGAYLCFEGFEKISHKFLHKEASKHRKQQVRWALLDKSADMLAFEKEKIKGAIRTDFILSAEIIVIALGTVKSAPLITQVIVVALIATVITVGVYSLVACIVKIDDLGLYLLEDKNKPFKQAIGRLLLAFAPRLMKTLSVVGTAAMFLVGGGILLHGFHAADPLIQLITETSTSLVYIGTGLRVLVPLLINAVVGISAGGILVMFASACKALLSGKPED